MKSAFLLLLLTVSFSTYSQKGTKKELATIETVEQAQNYIDSKKSKKNKIIVFNEEKHKTRLAKTLLHTAKGATEIVRSEFTKTHYKVIEKLNEPHYRVSYIFFDERKLDIEKIYELRKTILNKYETGIRFEDLAKRYSMADNALIGGDSGWLKTGEMPKEVEDETTNLSHQINDIYTVSVPSNNGYYIIIKTHRIRKIKEVKVLKVNESI